MKKAILFIVLIIFIFFGSCNFSKNDKTYVIRPDKKGNPTLDVKKPGTNTTTTKIRLQEPLK